MTEKVTYLPKGSRAPRVRDSVVIKAKAKSGKVDPKLTNIGQLVVEVAFGRVQTEIDKYLRNPSWTEIFVIGLEEAKADWEATAKKHLKNGPKIKLNGKPANIQDITQ